MKSNHRRFSPAKILILMSLSCALTFACSAEPAGSDGSGNYTVESGADGSQVITRAPGADLQDAADTALEKRNCSHIQFCNGPGTLQVVCRYPRATSCTNQQINDECFAEAFNICGHGWTKISIRPE